MKIIKGILIIGWLFLSILSQGQNALTFKLANPKILYSTAGAAGQYFEFDILVKAQAAHYLYSGDISLTFNAASLSTLPARWVFTLGPDFSDAINFPNSNGFAKYTILTKSITSGTAGFSFAGDVGLMATAPLVATDWTTISTTVFQTFVHVKVLLAGDANGVAGIDFNSINMDGAISYLADASLISQYTIPNLYDPAGFSTTYLGRIYSVANGWTQTGGSVNNAVFTDWTASVNTSVWDGNVILPDVVVPAAPVKLASNLRIHSPATLTIPVTGQLTVSGNTDVLTPGGLIIQSNASGTGSLITSASTGVGGSIVDRWMSLGKWNMVSSPLSGQSVIGFLGDVRNNNIPTKPDLITRGMMDYNPTLNNWNPFFTNSTAGNFGTGNGFSMRVDLAAAAVTFSGLLQAGPLSATGLTAAKWNLIGNPYTSAIGINNLSSSTAKFIATNASNFDPLFGAIYVWEQTDALNTGLNGQYTVINNASPAFEVQQGQAFFVKMNTGATAMNFNSGMQIHNTGLALKATKTPWPTIKLKTTVGGQNSSTIIAFNSSMTKGLDPTYDAGLLKGSSDLIVYSSLVEGDGIPFAIQALPENDLTSMIIPVGIDFKTGGDVVFSADLFNLPANSKVVLEDKVAKTFTDLSKNTYKVAIAANSSISDRFQLHTTDLSSKLGNNEIETLAGKLNAYAIKNIEIRVVGEVSNEAVATLYDVQGKVILIENLQEGSLNVIPTTSVKMGIYMLSVKDKGSVQTFKLMIRE